tara:strand:- start:1358 stop:1717 length:360 start_codon:yes stop_codon:yes gene_type:complete
MSKEDIEWKEAKKPKKIEYNKEELKIIEIIKTIYDPEIPVNIFDLGLIYSIDIDKENDVKINMTLTSPFCPVAESLPEEVRKKVEAMNETKSAKVEVTFDPPWNMDMMSDEARVKLNMF